MGVRCGWSRLRVLAMFDCVAPADDGRCVDVRPMGANGREPLKLLKMRFEFCVVMGKYGGDSGG